ncbi:hypothetical protein HHI36_001887 [Cryptolaemus montrouzieri]|uniref:Uncharacterized protein n=1 Tax=Cryptolaemus montrouzieri TaxID=559131 RepID=A0ABD2P8Z0_9CUCU
MCALFVFRVYTSETNLGNDGFFFEADKVTKKKNHKLIPTLKINNFPSLLYSSNQATPTLLQTLPPTIANKSFATVAKYNIGNPGIHTQPIQSQIGSNKYQGSSSSNNPANNKQYQKFSAPIYLKRAPSGQPGYNRVEHKKCLITNQSEIFRVLEPK